MAGWLHNGINVRHRELNPYTYVCCTLGDVRGTSAGPHKIDVTYEGLRVPNSPFTAGVVPGCDPSRVKVYGPG